MLKVLVVEDQPAVCTALELLFELNSLARDWWRTIRRRRSR